PGYRSATDCLLKSIDCGLNSDGGTSPGACVSPGVTGPAGTRLPGGRFVPGAWVTSGARSPSPAETDRNRPALGWMTTCCIACLPPGLAPFVPGGTGALAGATASPLGPCAQKKKRGTVPSTMVTLSPLSRHWTIRAFSPVGRVQDWSTLHCRGALPFCGML